MPKLPSEHPTDLELLILKVLWKESPLPVREVRDRLATEGRVLAHTTVITTLNVMVKKRYVARVRRGKALFFSPVLSKQQVSSGMLGDLVARVFDGSAASVVLSLFQCQDVRPAELKELRRIINQQSKGKQS